MKPKEKKAQTGELICGFHDPGYTLSCQRRRALPGMHLKQKMKVGQAEVG